LVKDDGSLAALWDPSPPAAEEPPIADEDPPVLQEELDAPPPPAAVDGDEAKPQGIDLRGRGESRNPADYPDGGSGVWLVPGGSIVDGRFVRMNLARA
jgi:hypothetical protein